MKWETILSSQMYTKCEYVIENSKLFESALNWNFRILAFFVSHQTNKWKEKHSKFCLAEIILIKKVTYHNNPNSPQLDLGRGNFDFSSSFPFNISSLLILFNLLFIIQKKLKIHNSVSFTSFMKILYKFFFKIIILFFLFQFKCFY